MSLSLTSLLLAILLIQTEAVLHTKTKAPNLEEIQLFQHGAFPSHSDQIFASSDKSTYYFITQTCKLKLLVARKDADLNFASFQPLSNTAVTHIAKGALSEKQELKSAIIQNGSLDYVILYDSTSATIELVKTNITIKTGFISFEWSKTILSQSQGLNGEIYLATVADSLDPNHLIIHFCANLDCKLICLKVASNRSGFVYGKFTTYFNLTETIFYSPKHDSVTCEGILTDETGVWIVGYSKSASFLGEALLDPFTSSYLPDTHSHIFVLSLHPSYSARKWIRIFGLPGYNDLNPKLSLLGNYLYLSYSTREPDDLSTGSASSYSIKTIRIDKSDGIVASSSILQSTVGALQVLTQQISTRGLFMLAQLPSGQISSSVDPLTSFKLQSSLLREDNTAFGLVLIEPLSLRLIELEPLPQLSITNGYYELIATSTDNDHFSPIELIYSRPSKTGLFLAMFSHSDSSSQAPLAVNSGCGAFCEWCSSSTPSYCLGCSSAGSYLLSLGSCDVNCASGSYLSASTCHICSKDCSACSDQSTCSACAHSSLPSCQCSNFTSLSNICQTSCSINDWNVSPTGICNRAPSSFQLRHSVASAPVVDNGNQVLTHFLHPTTSVQLKASSNLLNIPHLRTGFSFSLWLSLDNTFSTHSLLNLFGNVALSYSAGSSFILTISQLSSDQTISTTPFSFSSNQWYHIFAILSPFDSSTELMHVYGTSHNLVSSVSSSTISLSLLRPPSSSSITILTTLAYIAEIAYYSPPLSSTEHSILLSEISQRLSPHPQLLYYWPLSSNSSTPPFTSFQYLSGYSDSSTQLQLQIAPSSLTLKTRSYQASNLQFSINTSSILRAYPSALELLQSFSIQLQDASYSTLVSSSQDKVIITTAIDDSPQIILQYSLNVIGQVLTLSNLPSANIAASTLPGGYFYSFFYYLSNSSSLTHLATVYISILPHFQAHEGLRILHGSYITTFLRLGPGINGGDQVNGDILILQKDCSQVSSVTVFATQNRATLRSEGYYPSQGIEVPPINGTYYLCFRSLLQTQLNPTSTLGFNLLPSGSSYKVCQDPPTLLLPSNSNFTVSESVLEVKLNHTDLECMQDGDLMALKLAIPLPSIQCNDNHQVQLTRSGGTFPPYMVGDVLGLKAAKSTQKLAICWKPANSDSSVAWTKLRNSSSKSQFPIWFPTTSSPEIGNAHPFHTNNGIFLLNQEDFLQLQLSLPLLPVNTKTIKIKTAAWTPTSGFSITSQTIITFTFSASHSSDWRTIGQFSMTQDNGGAATLTLSIVMTQFFLTISSIDSYLTNGNFYALVVESGALSSEPAGAGLPLLPQGDLTLYFQTPNFSITTKSSRVPPTTTYLTVQGDFLDNTILSMPTRAHTSRVEISIYFIDSPSSTLECSSMTPTLGWSSVLDQTHLAFYNLNISECLSYDGSASLYANIKIYRELGSVGSGEWWTQHVSGLKIAEIGCPDPYCLYCSGDHPDDGTSICHSCRSSGNTTDLILKSSWECATACPSDQEYLLHQLIQNLFQVTNDVYQTLSEQRCIPKSGGCPFGYYLAPAINVCHSCPLNCRECTLNSMSSVPYLDCAQCESTFFLVNYQTCIYECPTPVFTHDYYTYSCSRESQYPSIIQTSRLPYGLANLPINKKIYAFTRIGPSQILVSNLRFTQVLPTNMSLFADYSSLEVTLPSSQVKLSSISLNAFSEDLPFQFSISALDSSDNVLDQTFFSFYKNSPPLTGTFIVSSDATPPPSGNFATGQILSLNITNWRDPSTRSFGAPQLRLFYTYKSLTAGSLTSPSIYSHEYILLEGLPLPASRENQFVSTFRLPPLSQNIGQLFRVQISLQMSDSLYARSLGLNTYTFYNSYSVSDSATYSSRREELFAQTALLDFSQTQNTLYACALIQSLVPNYPHSPSKSFSSSSFCRSISDCGGFSRGDCDTFSGKCKCLVNYYGSFCQFTLSEIESTHSISQAIISTLWNQFGGSSLLNQYEIEYTLQVVGSFSKCIDLLVSVSNSRNLLVSPTIVTQLIQLNRLAMNSLTVLLTASLSQKYKIARTQSRLFDSLILLSYSQNSVSYLSEMRVLFDHIRHFEQILARSMKSLDNNDESFTFSYSFPSYSLKLQTALLSDFIASHTLLQLSTSKIYLPSDLNLALGAISPYNIIRTAVNVWHYSPFPSSPVVSPVLSFAFYDSLGLALTSSNSTHNSQFPFVIELPILRSLSSLQIQTTQCMVYNITTQVFSPNSTLVRTKALNKDSKVAVCEVSGPSTVALLASLNDYSIELGLQKGFYDYYTFSFWNYSIALLVNITLTSLYIVALAFLLIFERKSKSRIIRLLLSQISGVGKSRPKIDEENNFQSQTRARGPERVSPLQEDHSFDNSLGPSPLQESRLGGLGVSRRNLVYGDNAITTGEAELDVSYELNSFYTKTFRSKPHKAFEKESPQEQATLEDKYTMLVRREMSLKSQMIHGVRLLNLISITSVEFPRHTRLTIYLCMVCLQLYGASLFYETLPMKDNLSWALRDVFAIWRHPLITFYIVLASLPFSYFLAWAFKLGFSLRRISSKDEFISTLRKQRVKLAISYFLAIVIVGACFVGISKFCHLHRDLRFQVSWIRSGFAIFIVDFVVDLLLSLSIGLFWKCGLHCFSRSLYRLRKFKEAHSQA